MRSKHLLKVGAGLAVVALLVAGCSSSGKSASPSPSVLPGGAPFAGPVAAGEGTLNILDWPGYALPAWTTAFTQQTGCKVNVKDFTDSNQAVSLMQSGGYDVVSASGDATLRLIYGGQVQPVNTALVSTWADINPQLKNQSFNSVNGQMYGIPHGRGANVLEYNTAVVKPAPTSWSIVFDPNSPYKGKITIYDSSIYIADAALYLMTHQPDLGITDPYALDAKQFAAAIALLKAQKPLVGNRWSDVTKLVSDFGNGTIVAGTSWQYNVLAADPATKVSSVVPSEGSTGWSDTWMVAKNTQHINCAYKWLDYISSPKVNAQVAESFGEAPSNLKACDYTTDKNFCTEYHATDTAFWKNVWYWNTARAKCIDGRTDVVCIDNKGWEDAWSKLINS
jgi:putative spermidine/putrescine transport system substrate-binding protein